NAGNLTIGSSSTFAVTGAYFQTGGATGLAGGTLASTIADIRDSTLSGSGTINGDVVTAGKIDWGGDGTSGILTINGNFIQTRDGVLAMGLGGLIQGSQYDLLRVSGAAVLDGTLAVNLINGFSPQLGNSFRILTFGSRAGDFATDSFPDLGDS